MTVRAMKDGALEFLTKPVRSQDLLDAVQKAVERDRESRKERAELNEMRLRFDSLTPREREVLKLVVAGLLNKQIADELGTCSAASFRDPCCICKPLPLGRRPDEAVAG